MTIPLQRVMRLAPVRRIAQIRSQAQVSSLAHTVLIWLASCQQERHSRWLRWRITSSGRTACSPGFTIRALSLLLPAWYRTSVLAKTRSMTTWQLSVRRTHLMSLTVLPVSRPVAVIQPLLPSMSTVAGIQPRFSWKARYRHHLPLTRVATSSACAMDP